MQVTPSLADRMPTACRPHADRMPTAANATFENLQTRDDGASQPIGSYGKRTRREELD
jgi:hypothetical protein